MTMIMPGKKQGKRGLKKTVMEILRRKGLQRVQRDILGAFLPKWGPKPHITPFNISQCTIHVRAELQITGCNF